MFDGCGDENDEYNNGAIKLLLCYDDDNEYSRYYFGIMIRLMITIVIMTMTMTMTTTTLLVTMAVDLKKIVKFSRYHS